MRKSENDVLLKSPSLPTQLALPLAGDTQEPEWKKWRSPEQEGQFQQHLTKLRNEVEIVSAIARELFPESQFAKLWELPSEQYAKAWEEYRKRNPQPIPLNLPDKNAVPTPKKFKPLIPWSLDRKQKDRRRRMVERLKQKHGFVPGESKQSELVAEYSPLALWIEEVQNTLCQNPGHFGVCSLPGCGTDRSPVVLPNLEQERAIAYENELRMKEAGLVPVNIPVNLKERELVLIGSEVGQNETSARLASRVD